jgi:hypothetical protein
MWVCCHADRCYGCDDRLYSMVLRWRQKKRLALGWQRQPRHLRQDCGYLDRKFRYSRDLAHDARQTQHAAMDASQSSCFAGRQHRFAVFFILIFVRNAEVAIARHSEQCAKENKSNDAGIGSLTNWQLSWILFMAWVAVTSFLWGFLYLGRLALRF